MDNSQTSLADSPLIAGYDFDANLAIWGLDESRVMLTQYGHIWEIIYHNPPRQAAVQTWSNDGSMLAFLEPVVGSQYTTTRIDIYDLRDNSIQKINADAVQGTPLIFSQDDQQIYYFAFGEAEDAPTPEGMTGTWQQFPLLLNSVGIEMNAQQQAVLDEPISHIFAGMFGGGGICEIDLFAQSEVRDYRYFLPDFFAETPFGLLAYYEDTLMFDMQSVDITGFSHFALSNDHARLIAVEDETKITLIDLETLATQSYETDTPIESVTWNGGDYAHYTTVEYGSELITDDDWELLDMWYSSCGATINTITIHRLDLETGEQQAIYTEAFSAINRMALAPDGNVLYFSALPNGEAWLDNQVNNNCDVDNCITDLMPSVYRLDLETGEADMVFESVLKATFNFID